MIQAGIDDLVNSVKVNGESCIQILPLDDPSRENYVNVSQISGYVIVMAVMLLVSIRLSFENANGLRILLFVILRGLQFCGPLSHIFYHPHIFFLPSPDDFHFHSAALMLIWISNGRVLNAKHKALIIA